MPRLIALFACCVLLQSLHASADFRPVSTDTGCDPSVGVAIPAQPHSFGKLVGRERLLIEAGKARFSPWMFVASAFSKISNPCNEVSSLLGPYRSKEPAGLSLKFETGRSPPA